MVKIGSGAERDIGDLFLSRYACYLIIQNADPKKEVVALGQTYFAIQTRKQELADQEFDFNKKTEEEKRLFLRQEMIEHNKQLAEAATHKEMIILIFPLKKPKVMLLRGLLINKHMKKL
ncbi:MAG: hypothetical protein U9Q83_00320 [Bacteroidota bacterium]|nr:hypothetical protein [Bacteroidota bacterium]